MSELMKAAEARKTIDMALDQVAVKLKKGTTEIIHNAVNQGLSQVSLDIPYSHTNSIKAWLESFGYRVDTGSDYRDSWFTVMW